jgi:type IV secretory pathway TrbD component
MDSRSGQVEGPFVILVVGLWVTATFGVATIALGTFTVVA